MKIETTLTLAATVLTDKSVSVRCKMFRISIALRLNDVSIRESHRVAWQGRTHAKYIVPAPTGPAVSYSAKSGRVTDILTISKEDVPKPAL